jgi:sugar-specific transcriptional regulator TrmB
MVFFYTANVALFYYLMHNSSVTGVDVRKTPTMDISYFRQIGLTEIQQDLYLFLVQHGRSIASLLARRLNYLRPTVYSALKGLEKKGLVRSYVSGSVSYFEATEPKALVNLCKVRINQEEKLLENAEQMVQQLEAFTASRESSVQAIRGDIKYYKGAYAVTTMLYESIEETARLGIAEHLCIGSCLWDSTMDWHSDYVKKRVSLGIMARMILPESKRQYYDTVKERNLYDLRFVSDVELPMGAECDITGERVNIYISGEGRDDVVGIKIYSRPAALVLQSLYSMAWKSATK